MDTHHMTPSPAPIANGTRVDVLGTSLLPPAGRGTVIKGEWYWGLGRYTVALDSGDMTYPGGQSLRVVLAQ